MSTSPSQMPEAPENQEQELCLQCLEPNPPGTHFCRKCGGQLTAYAATGPFEALFAEGNAYRRAAEQPQRLIVVMGIWLIFGIGAWAGIGMVAASSGSAGVLSAVAGIAMAALSVFIIVKTTRNYRKRSSEQTTATM